MIQHPLGKWMADTIGVGILDGLSHAIGSWMNVLVGERVGMQMKL